MITTPRTMPESDFTPDDSRDRLPLWTQDDPSVDELLNASELQTVLEMLAVMETAEELSQLQALTEAQKRQVWETTPESLKQKLWEIRNQPSLNQPSLNPPHQSPIALPIAESAAMESRADSLRAFEPEETGVDSDADEIEDLGQELEPTADAYPPPAYPPPEVTEALRQELAVPQPRPQPRTEQFGTEQPPEMGDRVILKAHPKLTASELKAVWELKRIQGDAGEVHDPNLGTRIYPLKWLVVYARAEAGVQLPLEPLESDSEEPF